LNILMGQQPNADLDVQLVDVGQIVLPDYQTALALMLENNPSVRQFESQVKIQKLSLQIAKEAYLPLLSGSYSASQNNNITGGGSNRSDQLSLRLSLDVFNGFSKSLNVQQSKLSLDEAQLDYDALLRDLDEALSNQYEALATQNQLIAIHEINLASARKDLEVVSEQYANGFSSILDLTDAQVSILESETSLLQDFYTRKLIESEIRRLIGN
jgi:outer membrane protein TolC